MAGGVLGRRRRGAEAAPGASRCPLLRDAGRRCPRPPSGAWRAGRPAEPGDGVRVLPGWSAAHGSRAARRSRAGSGPRGRGSADVGRVVLRSAVPDRGVPGRRRHLGRPVGAPHRTARRAGRRGGADGGGQGSGRPSRARRGRQDPVGARARPSRACRRDGAPGARRAPAWPRRVAPASRPGSGTVRDPASPGVGSVGPRSPHPCSGVRPLPPRPRRRGHGRPGDVAAARPPLCR